jgi:hypothetical protein
MTRVYAGRFLRVDLDDGKVQEQAITEEQAQQWLLGSGLAARLFADEMDAGWEPFDPASPLMVFNGDECAGGGADVLVRAVAPDRHLGRVECRRALGGAAPLRRFRWPGCHGTGRDARVPVGTGWSGRDQGRGRRVGARHL